MATRRTAAALVWAALFFCRAEAAGYNYADVIGKSILFYEAQRSGKLPASNRIPWRGDSALSDKGEKGEDLTGGWYDAGDHVKFGFPMAFATTLLTWGLLDYESAYKSSGLYDLMLDCIKWPLSYFIKAHTSKFEFYGQVGKVDLDHNSWGRAEDMTMSRPAYKITQTKPGSELAAETAAAMAAGYLAFKTKDSSFALKLLQHAKDLYAFAEQYQGKYTVAIPDAKSSYDSYSGFQDELAWGAAWLFRATQDGQYLTLAKKYYSAYVGDPFCWDSKLSGTQVLLYNLTKQATYSTTVQKAVDHWLPGNGMYYTPKGLAYENEWGSLRYSANTAFLALVAADMGLKPTEYRKFAKSQIDYMLGSSGRSFVVGYGVKPPNAPHHAGASCPAKPATCSWTQFSAPGPNPNILTGALVGGPDRQDGFKDDRKDYKLNEVTTDYNAGFQSALAAIKSLEMRGLLG